MTEIRDDLSPTEGVSDVFLEFDGMKTRLGSAHGEFTFRFVQRRDGQEKVIATMSFPVQAGHDGHPGMMVRAYDQLIALLLGYLFQLRIGIEQATRIERLSHSARWSWSIRPRSAASMSNLNSARISPSN